MGKDIAYHLWKFGLLPGKDFGYQPFHQYPSHTCWISTSGPSAPDAPTFGKADAIYNVIDSRQNDPQNNVVLALRGMGFTEAADRYTPTSATRWSRSPHAAPSISAIRSARKTVPKPTSRSAGRKGFGVKADDLLDQLIAAAQAEVDARHAELPHEERVSIATQIAVGALRYFMLRFTRNTVIAFDFKDALSFEGETGPYIQYAIVRAANILRKADTDEASALAAIASLDLTALDTEQGSVLWETWLACSKLTLLLEQCIATAEPAYLSRYALPARPAVQQLLPPPSRSERDRSHTPRTPARNRSRRASRDAACPRLSRDRSSTRDVGFLKAMAFVLAEHESHCHSGSKTVSPARSLE